MKQEQHPSAFGQPAFEVGGAEPALEFLDLGRCELDCEGRFATTHKWRFRFRMAMGCERKVRGVSTTLYAADINRWKNYNPYFCEMCT